MLNAPLPSHATNEPPAVEVSQRSIAATITKLLDECALRYTQTRDTDFRRMMDALDGLRTAILALHPNDRRTPNLTACIVDTTIKIGALLVKKLEATGVQG